MSRRIGAVLAIVVLVVLILGGLTCYEFMKMEALKSCKISLANVNVRSIGLTSASLEVKLRIYNPSSIAATIDRATYSLYANDVCLGNGTISRTDIPPRETVIVTTPFELSYSKALSVVWSYLNTGSVTWRIKGVAYFDTPLGPLAVPFEEKL